MPRYKASTDSWDIGHSCCYGAAVVDTTKPYPYGKKDQFCPIAECNDEATAEMIANALNAMELPQ